MKIDTICNELLVALTEVGYNEHTIFNYKGVIRRFKTFCNERGVTLYTPELGKMYAEDVISKKQVTLAKTDTILRVALLVY